MTRGFTFIEVLIYIFLLSFMLGGLFASAIYIHDATLRNKVAAEDLVRSLNDQDALDQGRHIF